MPSASGAIDCADRQVSARSISPPFLVVVAFADQLHVDREVATLGPALPLGEHRPAAGEHEDEVRGIVGDEQRRHQPCGGLDLLGVLVSCTGSRSVTASRASSSSTRGDRARRHDDQRRAVCDARRRHPQQRTLPVKDEPVAGQLEHLEQPLVDHRRHVVGAPPVAYVDTGLRVEQLGERREVGLEPLPGLDEPRSRCRPALLGLGVPRIAPL